MPVPAGKFCHARVAEWVRRRASVSRYTGATGNVDLPHTVRILQVETSGRYRRWSTLHCINCAVSFSRKASRTLDLVSAPLPRTEVGVSLASR